MKRRIIFVALLGLVAAFAVFLIVSFNRAAARTALIGGLKLAVLEVLPGDKEFTTQKPWHRWSREILPDRYQNWIPDALWGFGSGRSNSISIYVDVVGTNAVHAAEFENTTYRAVSLVGESFALGRSPLLVSSDSSKLNQAYELSMDSFPKRDPEFTLKLFSKHGIEIGSVQIANPIRGPFPVWTSQSLPQTVSNDDVDLTLTAVKEFRSSMSEEPNLSAEYDLKSSNPHWSGALVSHTIYADATGNEGAPLSRRESAWRVQALVHRKEGKRMRDNEKLVLTNLVAPAPGTLALQPTNSVLAGVPLRIAAIAGPGTLYRTNSTNWHAVPPKQKEAYSTGFISSPHNPQQEPLTSIGFPRPFLLIETDGTAMTDGAELYAQAFDKSGSEVRIQVSRPYPKRSGSWTMRAIWAEEWKTGTLSRLEIFISRPKTFEFYVNPADVKINNPAK